MPKTAGFTRRGRCFLVDRELYQKNARLASRRPAARPSLEPFPCDKTALVLQYSPHHPQRSIGGAYDFPDHRSFPHGKNLAGPAAFGGVPHPLPLRRPAENGAHPQWANRPLPGRGRCTGGLPLAHSAGDPSHSPGEPAAPHRRRGDTSPFVGGRISPPKTWRTSASAAW